MSEILSEKTMPAAVLFADLVGSTGLYDVKGDKAARQLVGLYLANLKQQIQQNSGITVKSLGDGILAYFLNMDDAVQAALDIHQSDSSFNGQTMLSHVGIHYGEIILRKGDIFGDAVNLAARLSDLAKAEQTILSEQAAQSTSDIFQEQLRNIDKTIIKGKKEAINIYEVVIQDDDQTVMFSPDILKKMTLEKSLNLTCQDKHYSLSQTSPALTIGRDKECDISISSPMISRHHAKINYHKGVFTYIDQSTNGSYLYSRKTENAIFVESFLRREQQQLTESGIISVGSQKEKNTADQLIHFSIAVK
ncbi:MAG: adenylate/guanylate cyclase domain-containing protein [gamma proteobacterium symbiont of Taylorina sp.]|nr:adenylate/guanylate cyclase domain-containing protein [gamma proteobacterium symbiont of Taylorina sp.]